MTQDEIDNIKYGEPMTTHDRDKVIAAAKEADSGFTGDEHFNLGTSLVGLEAIELFYAIAFEDGRQAEREEIATSLTPYYKPNKTEVELMADAIAFRLVEAIRARGDTK